jgi:hypothetical protein
MSVAMSLCAPGRTNFTATFVPGGPTAVCPRVVATWTCAIVAVASGVNSNVANASSSRRYELLRLVAPV